MVIYKNEMEKSSKDLNAYATYASEYNAYKIEVRTRKEDDIHVDITSNGFGCCASSEDIGMSVTPEMARDMIEMLTKALEFVEK